MTCPLGTDFRGAVSASANEQPAKTSVLRFPLSVFTPLDSKSFSGRVAMARLLVGTGSTYYEPYGIPLAGVLLADIGEGRIQSITGDADQVTLAKAHYEYVGGLLGLDPYAIHSWHAGIHPGCSYPMRAEANYERWSSGAFGNPRVLHFHTCGNYAPGEISLNVVDATVSVDGIAVWERGVLYPERVPGADEIMQEYPEAAAVFQRPAPEIGL